MTEEEKQQQAAPQDNLQKLASALENGAGHISASNRIGLSSGVFGQGGRELTAAEAQFQLRRADTTADYAHRKMLSSLRGADSMNPKERAEAGRNAAALSALEKLSRGDAAILREQMAGSALDNLTRPMQVALGGFGKDGNGLNTPAKVKLQQQMLGMMSSARKNARDAARGLPAGAPAPAAPLPATAAPPPTTTAKSAFGGGSVNAYDFDGGNVEFPAGFDMNNQEAVANYQGFTSFLLDDGDDDGIA